MKVSEPITLDTPVKRGEVEITTLSLRKPNAGEMRGLALYDVMRLDVQSLITLIPRISMEGLTEAEVAGLDPADLVQCGGEVAGFFMPKGMSAMALVTIQ